MPISVRVEASGIYVSPRLANAISRYLPGALPHRVYGAGLAAAARVIRDQARVLVPHPGASRTNRSKGNLQRSIKARRRARRVGGRRIPGGSALTVAGGVGARHSVLTEKGWRTRRLTPAQTRQPYLVPALRSTVSEQSRRAGNAMARNWIRLARDIKARNTSKLTKRLVGL